jgi:hypothetical protein
VITYWAVPYLLSSESRCTTSRMTVPSAAATVPPNVKSPPTTTGHSELSSAIAPLRTPLAWITIVLLGHSHQRIAFPCPGKAVPQLSPMADDCIICGNWPERDRWALREMIDRLPLDEDSCIPCRLAILRAPSRSARRSASRYSSAVSSRSRGAAGMGSRPPVSRRSMAPTHRHRRLSGRRTTGPPIKGASVSYGSKGLGLRMRDVVVSRAQGEVASVPRDGADLPRSPWQSPPSARRR